MPVITIDANQLRWLAEEADGRREQKLALVGHEDKLILVDDTDARYKDGFFQVRTKLAGGQGLSGGGEIGITYNGKNVRVGDADAAFFTQSAVEKFILPYYTRMWPLTKIDALRGKLFADGVIVALHDPPSITKAISEEDLTSFKALLFDGRDE